MAPFDLLDPDPPGAFGRTPDRNAYVELHNMIAAATSIHEFGPDDLVRIGRDHDVDFLGGAFATERGELYARFLRHAVSDGDLAPTERATAAHLARTLYLERGALRRIHARVFGHTVAQVIADDCLDPDEQLLLFTLQHTLGIDPDRAEESYEDAARERLLQRIAHALCDGQLDPEEASEIQAMEQDLGVDVPDRVEAMLATAAERYRLLHGDLRPLALKAPIDLREGEAVFWTGLGHWSEASKPRGSRASDVPFLRRSSLQRILGRLRGRTSDAAGRITLTNERLLLSRHRRIGSKDPRTVALRKVIDVTHRDGFVLLTRDGKIDWLLRLDGEASVFATMVTRLLRDEGDRPRREREKLRAEEQRWKQGHRPPATTDAEVQAKLREAEAYAAEIHARTEARPTPDAEPTLPRYRGPLLFQPERGETVHLSVPARWNADEAISRAVEADPNVPKDSIVYQRTRIDRQNEARGEGTLYLTNTRLLLIDPRSATVLFPLPTITGVTVGNGFVEIERAQHLGRVIYLAERMEFARTLEALVRGANR